MPKISLTGMNVDALLKLRDDVDAQLDRKRSDLHAQLAALGDTSGARAGRGTRGSKLAGRKVAAKYRSLNDPSLQWAGRGATPRWMRDEMKAGKLKKDAFLIKAS